MLLIYVLLYSLFFAFVIAYLGNFYFIDSAVIEWRAYKVFNHSWAMSHKKMVFISQYVIYFPPKPYVVVTDPILLSTHTIGYKVQMRWWCTLSRALK